MCIQVTVRSIRNLAIECIDKLKHSMAKKTKYRQAAWLFLIFIVSILGFPDYGYQGVLTVVVFYLVRGIRWEPLWQLAAMIWIHVGLFEGLVVPVDIGGWHYEIPTQGFAVLALLPIWMYNGKAGTKNKILQYGFYIFYPLHMLILFMLRRMM